jgi:hypothetical protein
MSGKESGGELVDIDTTVEMFLPHVTICCSPEMTARGQDPVSWTFQFLLDGILCQSQLRGRFVKGAFMPQLNKQTFRRVCPKWLLG